MLLTVSTDIKRFINRYTNQKEIFDLQERHDNMELKTNKNLLATTLTVYLLCKHKKH